MRLVFNLRDAKALDWDGFWEASTDPDTPIARFGFAMCVLDIEQDAPRIATALRDRMRWVKATLRAEDLATMKKNYAIVHDCKSHRAIEQARYGLRTRARSVENTTRLEQEMRAFVSGLFK